MVLVLSSVTGCASHLRRTPPANVAVVEPATPEPAAEQPSGPPVEQPLQAKPGALPSHTPSAADLELRFMEGFLGMSREAQRRVYAQVEATYLQDRAPRNLVRYALLTVATGTDHPASVSRVRTDLRGYLEPGGDGAAADNGLVPLAALLLRVLDDREQLTAQYVAQTDQLQKKLDELKAIEQQLLERSESTRPNPP